MNSDDEIAHSSKGAAPDGFVGELAEPALDQIQPRRAGGDEVEMEAVVLGEPSLDLGVGMGAVVVQNQMQFQVLWGACIGFETTARPSTWGRRSAAFASARRRHIGRAGRSPYLQS